MGTREVTEVMRDDGCKRGDVLVLCGVGGVQVG